MTTHDRGDAVCGHVRDVLQKRLDDVRGQIAELVGLEGHLESLLHRAEQKPPSEHDLTAVCWILDNELGNTGSPASRDADGQSLTCTLASSAMLMSSRPYTNLRRRYVSGR